MRIVFIGRFQPFHIGHASVIREWKKKGKMIVVIGSPNKMDENNPFPAELRRKMIRAVFPDVEIVEIPDSPSDEEWAETVMALKPDVVVTGNPWVKRCLAGKVRIEEPKMVEGVSGTIIREKMRKGEDISRLVPPEVLKVINEWTA